MKKVKKTIALGVGSMAGIGAMGAISNIPGMPAAAGNTLGIASSGINLANIGNLASIGMNIIPKNKIKKDKSPNCKHGRRNYGGSVSDNIIRKII